MKNDSQEKMKIGFIGLGFMGEGMAKNILAKGYALTILSHRNRAPIERLIALGAKEVHSPKEVAQQSDLVFLCVTGSPEVEATVRGENGLAAGGKKGLIIVDCSTANPVSTQALFDELAPKGIIMVDAPLGGTPVQAHEGTLSAMVGCDEATFKKIEPVILTWATKAVHLPKVGMGHQMKLLNNFLSMGYASIYSEALAIAEKSGISAHMLDDVVRGGRMDCGFYQTFFKYVLEGDKNAHLFTLKNAHKDVSYLASMADAAGVANPIGGAVRNYFTSALAQGKGDQFVPMLSDHVKALNGIKS